MIARAGRELTGSMKISSVPPLWQLIPYSTMPLSTGSPRSGLMRIRRGRPSAIACRAVLTTAGWAQPPPIQPCIVPSGSITAFAPGLAEVGDSQRTTVASAKGTPADLRR